MSRPIQLLAPELRLRDGVYYVFWYDKHIRRVRRRSLKTSDAMLAATALAEIAASLGEDTAPPVREEIRAKGPRKSWRHWAVKMCRRARENAKAKKREYDLDPGFIEEMLLRQDHRCAVSGIRFSDREFYRNPFAPSIDQIRPGAGYVRGNVRIVSVIVNTAMNGWGEGPFYRLVYECRVLSQVCTPSRLAKGGATSEKCQ